MVLLEGHRRRAPEPKLIIGINAPHVDLAPAAGIGDRVLHRNIPNLQRAAWETELPTSGTCIVRIPASSVQGRLGWKAGSKGWVMLAVDPTGVSWSSQISTASSVLGLKVCSKFGKTRESARETPPRRQEQR